MKYGLYYERGLTQGRDSWITEKNLTEEEEKGIRR